MIFFFEVMLVEIIPTIFHCHCRRGRREFIYFSFLKKKKKKIPIIRAHKKSKTSPISPLVVSSPWKGGRIVIEIRARWRNTRDGNKTVMAVNNCRAGTYDVGREIRKFVRLTGNTLCCSLMKIICCTLMAWGWYARYKPSPPLFLSPFLFLFLLSINIYTTPWYVPPSVDLFPMSLSCVPSARFSPSTRIKRKIVACFTCSTRESTFTRSLDFSRGENLSRFDLLEFLARHFHCNPRYVQFSSTTSGLWIFFQFLPWKISLVRIYRDFQTLFLSPKWREWKIILRWNFREVWEKFLKDILQRNFCVSILEKLFWLSVEKSSPIAEKLQRNSFHWKCSFVEFFLSATGACRVWRIGFWKSMAKNSRRTKMFIVLTLIRIMIRRILTLRRRRISSS